ncbi:hypothetical protein F1559_001159 [Cyanidiococcus yangmingshanensis]|uniref:Uncharacterized protein n=1 Tax=Cyanidiococcus yangmingshanensis TaxID=2690220 RepID=A0A7J7IG60_9RHOD|nr:hypothetical protein F1559_001159 [Cyanidiococcus yangmingshanensis]
MVEFPIERITCRLSATCSTILTAGENILMNLRWSVMPPETNPERTWFIMLLWMGCERRKYSLARSKCLFCSRPTELHMLRPDQSRVSGLVLAASLRILSPIPAWFAA